MAEETIQEVVETVAPAAAPEAPAPAEQKKPEGRRDIFAELGLADDDDKVKILKAKGSKNVTTGIVHPCAVWQCSCHRVLHQGRWHGQ